LKNLRKLSTYFRFQEYLTLLPSIVHEDVSVFSSYAYQLSHSNTVCALCLSRFGGLRS
jgi:hypothetical protein